MPFCPKCRQEFVARAARCPDCQVDLVATLSATPAGTLALEPFLIRGPAGLLAEIEATLKKSALPFRATEQGIEVPLGLSERISDWLLQTFEGERDGRSLTLIGRLEPESEQEEAPLDLAVLQVGRAELLANWERHLAPLRDVLARGDSAAAGAAMTRLVLLVRSGRIDPIELLIEAVRHGTEQAAYAWSNELRREPRPGLARRLVDLLPALNDERRIVALHVIKLFPDRSVADSMLHYLDSSDAEVRAGADEVLCSLSELDVGFDTDAEPAARAQAIRRWRDWIEDERARE